jgi:hypothetical protein
VRVRVEGIKAPELRATVDRICGRTRKSRYLNINPVWWFMNDDEQTVDQADWYHREWPYWRRWLYWNVFRNPLQNFRAYVLGASDKNYWVCGREPVMTVQRNDLVPPEYGYQSCVLYGGELWLPRLFLSYSGKSFVWYVGHQPSGFWGSSRGRRTRRYACAAASLLSQQSVARPGILSRAKRPLGSTRGPCRR